MNRVVPVGVVVLLVAGAAPSAEPPKPFGPVPSARQLLWHDLEVYGFLHFGPNTFTDKEWGYGDESERIFNPTDFDADQIARTAKEAGMRGLMLTCKHHDGFCLWPSKYTEHSVKNSPWREGKGDVVKEISEACRKHGLKFGTYLSPWDRNHKDYGRPEYVAYYRNQLRELMTSYGPIYEVWFDGANGGDGYYGGARTTRRIDNRTYYDWENTWKIVRELQPDACMFSDGGPDCRWVGNESGFAGETCWATINKKEMLPGVADARILNRGQREGADWLPAEVDVSIRPGWFYHAAEDSKVKSVEHLLKIYYESVGRGANLILNVPPDRRGRIHENDAKALREWRQVLEATFATDLARGAKATASSTRGSDPQFAPGNAVDGDRQTYWATDDAVTEAELVLDLGKDVTFNVVRIRECLPLGQRVDSVAVSAWDGQAWKEIAKATSIGAQRLLRVPSTTASKVRLRVTRAAACPAISEFGLFLAPATTGKAAQ
jgi:alpha-L-fucosidase